MSWVLKTHRKRPKVVKRKYLSFKTCKKSSPSLRRKSRQNESQSVPFESETLQRNNHQLAQALNNCKVQNSALQQRIGELNSELLDLRVQNAELKDQLKQKNSPGSIKATFQRQIELELQSKLQSYLDPMMTSLGQALDHTVGLSTTLTQSMQLATALDRKTKILGGSPSVQNSPTRTKGSVAQILPMVRGHCISQPRIRMDRVSDLMTMSNTAVPATARNETVVSDEETQPTEASPPMRSRQRQRRLRARNVQIRESNVIADMSDVVEGEEEEEVAAEEGAGDNRVLLIPRLVLERVSISPRRSPSSKRSFDTDMQPSRRKSAAKRKTRRSMVNLGNLSPTVVLQNDVDKILSQNTERNVRFCDNLESSSTTLANPYSNWTLPSSPQEDNSFLANDSIYQQPEQSPKKKNRGRRPKESNESTPSTKRRESSEEFFGRVVSIDPLEGPSWMFDDEGNKRSNPPKATTTKKAATPRANREQTRGSGSDENSRRSRRRAASAALGSLKEPTANKKLRQGDPNSSSIYSDFVPQTKSKRSSCGSSQVSAAKRQSLTIKKRSK